MASPEAPRPGAPVLVTGVPRSGTTWLARRLATARGAGMPGREPMNPRGGQWGLGGTLTGWTQLDEPTPRQARLLRRAYRGLEPRTWSRYGVRAHVAALPGGRVVVKDPFALLSLPAVVRTTGAVPVLVYRHPGAVLASYRRMGWRADTAELRRLQGRPAAGDGALDDVTAMGEFWAELHRRALARGGEVPGLRVVAHAELAEGGDAALHRLMASVGLRPRRTAPAPAGEAPTGPRAGGLHDFRRSAQEVAQGWRAALAPGEEEALAALTADVWDALEAARLPLGPPPAPAPAPAPGSSPRPTDREPARRSAP
ncbi:sulfotransferase [Vallicoccus soli]|uniref:Sulfotransferase family protein n=1 Tax=Vallicoccus soli TaxID=2339232 RepID=A0A3A3Z3B2_9ACTN|nr:sulfotransferase [Vallicoccus soli]RJK97892.1 hypothetical protein D5H78_02675 [Vallicoccus soli]